MTLQAAGEDRSSELARVEDCRLDSERAYSALLDEVTSQLRPQLSGYSAPNGALVVAIPTVGFGDQSTTVVSRTLELVVRQQSPDAPIVALVLVNRPASRPPDGTEAIVRQVIAEHAATAPSVRLAAASISVSRKPRLGQLRQLLVDAAVTLLQLPAHASTVIVADDDLVDVPPDQFSGIAGYMARNSTVDLALGPVLFDDPRLPSALFPGFLVGDLLRALLAARTVEHLAQLDVAVPVDRREIDVLSRQYFESIVLSSNLSVRLSALQRAGGFRDLNEITNVMRDVQDLRLSSPNVTPLSSDPGNNIAATWTIGPRPADALTELLRRAIRLSSRRALRAYVRDGTPSVGQWKRERFRASAVDPARVHQVGPITVTPISGLNRAGRLAMTRRMEQAVATTLDYFPRDPRVVTDALAALGLAENSGIAHRHNGRPGGSTVRLHPDHPLFDRIDAMQRAILEPYGLDGPARTVLLPLEGRPERAGHAYPRT